MTNLSILCYSGIMKNINVNLTKEQAKIVNEATKKYGFANRSEFFRSLLRYIFMYSPSILKKLDSFVFEEPPTKDANKIIAELEASGRHSEDFIKSLAAGLRKSNYFKK
ncbi:MAG: hypothetical protein HY397_03605 [Candidatus Doudnabacteria bacterium]|nr:hypothetical protein [Candidatus Doudnabacteria bacterium]